MSRSALVAWVAIPLILAGGVARAADSEADRLREQLRATVLQLRDLQDQQAAAAAKPVAAAPASPSPGLKAKLAATEAQLRAARREADAAAGLKATIDKAKADQAALSASAAATQAELNKYQLAFKQASDAGAAASAERDRLAALLATQTTIATACQAKNVRLTTFAEGLIAAANRATFGEKALAREPLIGFTRVRLENIAQDREDTVRATRCDPIIDARARAPAAAQAPAGQGDGGVK